MTESTLLKLALPEPFVLTCALPRKVCPSPKPEGSAVGLEKNSTVNLVLGVLVKLPRIVMLLPPISALVR